MSTTTTKRPATAPITSAGLIRVSGLFAIAAGAIYAGIQPIHPPDFLPSVTTSAWAVVMTLKFVMSLFFLIAIAGLYFRQMHKAGWLGFAGFVLFGLAWWLEAGYIFAELFILPPLAAVAPQYIDSFLGLVNGFPGEMQIGAIGPVYAMLGISYLLGGILLGLGTLRAGVLPRIPSVMLAVTALLTPAAVLLPHALQRFVAVPVGVAFIWLGLALWLGWQAKERGVPELRPTAAA